MKTSQTILSRRRQHFTVLIRFYYHYNNCKLFLDRLPGIDGYLSQHIYPCIKLSFFFYSSVCATTYQFYCIAVIIIIVIFFSDIRMRTEAQTFLFPSFFRLTSIKLLNAPLPLHCHKSRPGLRLIWISRNTDD